MQLSRLVHGAGKRGRNKKNKKIKICFTPESLRHGGAVTPPFDKGGFRTGVTDCHVGAMPLLAMTRYETKKFQEIFAKEDGNVQLFVVGKQG